MTFCYSPISSADGSIAVLFLNSCWRLSRTSTENSGDEDQICHKANIKTLNLLYLRRQPSVNFPASSPRRSSLLPRLLFTQMNFYFWVSESLQLLRRRQVPLQESSQVRPLGNIIAQAKVTAMKAAARRLHSAAQWWIPPAWRRRGNNIWRAGSAYTNNSRTEPLVCTRDSKSSALISKEMNGFMSGINHGRQAPSNEERRDNQRCAHDWKHRSEAIWFPGFGWGKRVSTVITEGFRIIWGSRIHSDSRGVKNRLIPL